jgi:hypothetical protein
MSRGLWITEESLITLKADIENLFMGGRKGKIGTVVI